MENETLYSGKMRKQCHDQNIDGVHAQAVTMSTMVDKFSDN